ncbi:hypothetical protein [Flavobacterium humi]|uniref:Uncharacterized protein n=1 Tax=Flavobacterium humi TaxID=2562683 RepID=A0A4Z0L5R5_9FLAO|nr:hypothetical protein [Flavobacterium humi]TGD57313.1 hypothetical protein E4635_11875 [Flavobacterium humi]
MKKLLTSKWFVVFFFLVQVTLYAQEGKIKIYESNSGDGSCVIVFPNSPEPLMVLTGNGACTVLKTMAMDDWHEMSATTVVTTSVVEPTGHTITSPRDAASGMATGKRQHKPFLLSDLTLNSLGSEDQSYAFSWNIKSNTGAKTAASRSSSRTVSNSCCADGVCTVLVSVSRKHTKSGHVTLMK